MVLRPISLVYLEMHSPLFPLQEKTLGDLSLEPTLASCLLTIVIVIGKNSDCVHLSFYSFLDAKSIYESPTA